MKDAAEQTDIPLKEFRSSYDALKDAVDSKERWRKAYFECFEDLERSEQERISMLPMLVEVTEPAIGDGCGCQDDKIYTAEDLARWLGGQGLSLMTKHTANGWQVTLTSWVGSKPLIMQAKGRSLVHALANAISARKGRLYGPTKDVIKLVDYL